MPDGEIFFGGKRTLLHRYTATQIHPNHNNRYQSPTNASPSPNIFFFLWSKRKQEEEGKDWRKGKETAKNEKGKRRGKREREKKEKGKRERKGINRKVYFSPLAINFA